MPIPKPSYITNCKVERIWKKHMTISSTSRCTKARPNVSKREPAPQASWAVPPMHADTQGFAGGAPIVIERLLLQQEKALGEILRQCARDSNVAAAAVEDKIRRRKRPTPTKCSREKCSAGHKLQRNARAGAKGQAWPTDRNLVDRLLQTDETDYVVSLVRQFHARVFVEDDGQHQDHVVKATCLRSLQEALNKVPTPCNPLQHAASLEGPCNPHSSSAPSTS